MYYPDTQILTSEGGLSVAEIAACLSSASRDLGTLCKSSEINKWAKYKPVRHGELVEMTLAQRASVNYGLGNIPYYLYVAIMLGDVRAGNMLNAANLFELDTRLSPWQYYAPLGGVAGSSASPFRVLDFDGYWHAAIAPIAGVSTPSVTRASDGLVVIGFSGASVSDDKALKLSDITVNNVSWANMYLTLCLYNASSQYYVTQMVTPDDVTTAVKISQLEDYGVFFRSRGIPVGTYKAFVFASDRVIQVSQTYPTSGLFVPLAFSLSDLTVAQATINVSMEFSAWRQNQLAAIYGSYVIVNGDSTGYGITGLTMQFLDVNQNVLHSISPAAPSTIAANETYSSGQLTLATTSVVSQRNLKAASQVLATLTVGGKTVSVSAPILSGPPRTI